MMYKWILIFVLCSQSLLGQNSLALLKYNGGGDWYANPTSLSNLTQFCNQQIGTHLTLEIPTVEAGSLDIFQYPYIHITGHGNIVFSEQETKNVRDYLLAGGFIHADDNYGLKPYFMKAMESVLQSMKWEKIPANHPIFDQKYHFENGLPKIHAHDGKPPIAWGVFHQGRLICLFTEESDLGDGWEDPEVHGDTKEIHLQALMMGANIIQYVFTQ